MRFEHFIQQFSSCKDEIIYLLETVIQITSLTSHSRFFSNFGYGYFVLFHFIFSENGKYN